jgi:hypothetical protein
MTTRAAAVSLVAVLGFSLGTFGSEKAELKERYSRRFLVVMREGLAVGVCSAPVAGPRVAPPELAVRISGDRSDYQLQSGATAMFSACREVVPEPLRRGEVLKASRAWAHGDTLHISVQNVSPHAVERVRGRSFETGFADLRFALSKPKDLTSSADEIERWVKPFDSAEEAAKFGNTASGVFVKQVKLGMSAAEVEEALGPPETRADLGDKVLYKYKDITVEFKGGKVVDVR